MKNSIKVLGARVLLQVALVTKKLDDGTEREEPSQEGKVLNSNSSEIKKGMTVFFNPYGAISVESMRTKKALFLIVDEEDVYACI